MKTKTIKKVNAKPYQFAFHDRVQKEAPKFEMWEKVVQSNGELSRDDKDKIFHAIQGNSGSGYYRLMGWIFPFAAYMKTYLVHTKFYGWQEMMAFDKTCFRNSWHTNKGIIEIIEKPQ